MKQLYFYMFGVISLLYISLPIWPNINTLCTVVDREKFYVFLVGHWVQTPGLLNYKFLFNLWCQMLPICIK
jgi:hypothetical protein